MAFTIFDERNGYSIVAVLDNSNTPGFVNLNGSTSVPIRFDAIFIANSDVIDHVVDLQASVSGSTSPIASILVPARSGYDGTPPVEIISAQMPANYQGFVVPLFTYAYLATADTMSNPMMLTAYAVGGTL